MIIGILLTLVLILLSALVVLYHRWSQTQVSLEIEKKEHQALVTEQALLQKEKEHISHLLEEEQAKGKTLSEEMKKEFELLSLKLLEERTKKLEEEGQQGLKQIVNPLKEQLDKYREDLDKIHKEQSEGRTRLDTQIRMLVEQTQKVGEDANQLAQAMRGNSKVQGDWGEKILQRLLEINGLREHVFYDSQVQISQYNGEAVRHSDTQKKLRPDVLVSLPENRGVVIDSKVSLTAYANYYEASNEEDKKSYLAEHIQSIRNHVSELSKKQYPRHWKEVASEIEILDFTLLFVPMEDALQVAIAQNSAIVEEAYHKQIILVTPLQLIPVLKILSDLWRMHIQQQNVQKIIERANSMYDKLEGIVTAMMTAQRAVGQAGDSITKALDRMSQGRGNLIGQFEALKKMGIAPKKTIPLKAQDPDSDTENPICLGE